MQYISTSVDMVRNGKELDLPAAMKDTRSPGHVAVQAHWNTFYFYFFAVHQIKSYFDQICPLEKSEK